MKGWRDRAAILLAVLALGCASLRGHSAAPPAPVASKPAPKPEDIQKEVLAQEARHLEALTKADTAALGEILRDDLTYIHSGGPLATKQQVLNEIISGKLRYRVIEPTEQTVRVFGDTAIITGSAQIRAVSSGKSVAFGIRFTAVWVRSNNAWQLAAWQATRLPD